MRIIMLAWSVVLLMLTHFSYAQISPKTLDSGDNRVVINGGKDRYGFFRFSSKDLLYHYYAYTIHKKIDGEFLFSKKVFDRNDNVTKNVVYFSSMYQNFDNNDDVTINNIKTLLLKKDTCSKIDVECKGFIVDHNAYKKVTAIKESAFLKRYVSDRGVISDFKDEQEKFAVLLRILSMNIPVGVADMSGDLMIPTYDVAEIW